MNWRIIAIPATLIPILIIAIRFNIKFEDVLAIGIIPFVLAVVSMIIKLGLQGIKFAYIAQKYLGTEEQKIRHTFGLDEWCWNLWQTRKFRPFFKPSKKSAQRKRTTPHRFFRHSLHV